MMLPSGSIGYRFQDSDEPWVTQMLQSEGDRVSLGRGAEFVHETFVSEGILDTQGRAQWSGEERGLHRMRQNALAPDSSGTATFPADATRDVGRCGIVAVAKFASWFWRGTWCNGFGRVSQQQASDDVARPIVAGPASSRRYPVFAIPSDNSSAGIDTRTLLDDTCGTEVLPRHFVFARKLNPDWPADRLRQHRRIERDGIRAV